MIMLLWMHTSVRWSGDTYWTVCMKRLAQSTCTSGDVGSCVVNDQVAMDATSTKLVLLWIKACTYNTVHRLASYRVVHVMGPQA